MDCRNCGAPMDLVPGRDYFYCAYCTSYFFPEENADGIRVLGEAAALSCPVCGVPLVSATIERLHVLHCARCRGLLIPQPTFYTVVGYLRRRAAGAPVRPPALNREELKRRLDCPSCRQPFSTHPYYGPGNIVIDVCAHCAFVWLDHGELRRIITAPGAAHEHWRAPGLR